MTRKSLIALVLIISCVYSPLRTSHAASLNTSPFGSILTNLNNDGQLCKSRSIFADSPYAKSCDSVDYPNGSLDDKNFKQFLCLGFYDRIHRLCWLGTLGKTGKTSLPENTTVFDAKVKKLLPKNDDDTLKFCESWENSYPPRYSKIENFVKQFDEAMKKPTTCVRICTNWEGKFDPICAVLASMDQISIETGVEVDDSKGKTVQEEKLTKESKESGKETFAPSGPIKVSQIQTAQTTLKSTGSKKIVKGSSGPDENIEKSSEDHSKILPTLKKEHETQATNVESQKSPAKAKKIEESKKPKESTAKVSETSLGNKEKIKTDSGILEHGEVKNSKDSSDHTKAQVHPDLNNNGQMDSPEETAIQLDPSDQDTDKILELPDEKVDVISDHTQEHPDEQIGGGGEPSDDANELEPPTMVPPNEDINENPAFPSEKQDILPRMPGIRNDDDSHFFGYFSIIGVICIAGYVGYHNKQKIFAMVLEGRRSRGGRGRRRPSTANYRKLDCTLEEAVTSQCNSNVTHVIY